MVVCKSKLKLMKSKNNPSNAQKGASLIEILVTVFVMAIGLLGLAALQMNNLKNINNSQFRSLATTYAYDMAERMRSNRVAIVNGDYDDINTATSVIPACATAGPSSSAACTSENMAKLDAYRWKEQLSASVISGGLPSGAGTVLSAAAGTNAFDIQVTWNEQGRDNTGGKIDNASFTLTIQP